MLPAGKRACAAEAAGKDLRSAIFSQGRLVATSGSILSLSYVLNDINRLQRGFAPPTCGLIGHTKLALEALQFAPWLRPVLTSARAA
jgi:hypothetical protein